MTPVVTSRERTVRSAVHALEPLLPKLPALSGKLLPLLLEPCPLSSELRQSVTGGAYPLCQPGCTDNWQVVKACAHTLAGMERSEADGMVRVCIAE